LKDLGRVTELAENPPALLEGEAALVLLVLKKETTYQIS
jgi:hypothetical protein